MLIRKGRQWQVCYQAKGTINFRRVTAWVFGPESTFFCELGEQDEIIMLPEKEAFFGGDFNYMIDRVDAKDVPIERLGGAKSVGAARAAYEYFKATYSAGVRLRQGARLVAEQGDDDE